MKALHHGDTAATARSQAINHGEREALGEKQNQKKISSWVFSVLSVSSVVKAFELAFRRELP